MFLSLNIYYPPPLSPTTTVEFTPEYIGVPPVIPNEQPNKTVGGGLVDTIVSVSTEGRAGRQGDSAG